jgi:hypothetical protein
MIETMQDVEESAIFYGVEITPGSATVGLRQQFSQTLVTG